jgi:hypothetical protein
MMRRSMIEVYRLSGTKIHHPISDLDQLFLCRFRYLKIASSSQPADMNSAFCMGDLVGRAERARPADKKVSDPGSERGLTPRVKFALAHTPGRLTPRTSYDSPSSPVISYPFGYITGTSNVLPAANCKYATEMSHANRDHPLISASTCTSRLASMSGLAANVSLYSSVFRTTGNWPACQ